MNTCPCCGGAMPETRDPMEVLSRLRLGPDCNRSSARIMSALGRNFGRTVSHDAIVDACYGHLSDGGPDDAADIVKVLICKRRKRLREFGIDIINEFGVGYRMVWLKRAVDYDPQKDLSRSIDVGFAHIRDRVAAGGPGWQRKES